ncbi:hypothetical protein [Geodermatophilus sp. URMC 64]
MTVAVVPVEMPQLSGGRKRAQALVRPISQQLRGGTVILDCRQLIAGTASFADEIVRLVLVDGGANLLEVRNVDRDFGQDLLTAAKDHGVSSQLRIV